jgi:hypothetical protein
MHKFSVSMDMKKKINNDKRIRDMVVGKVVTHLCLTLIIKELKINVEHDRVVTTLNIIFRVVEYIVYIPYKWCKNQYPRVSIIYISKMQSLQSHY